LAQRDIGCEACGAVLPMEISGYSVDKPNIWFPGKKCPMCGSEKFYPVIPITDTDRAQEQPTSIKRRLLLNPWTGIIALAVTIGVVLIVVLWPGRRMAESKGLFFCENCKEVFSDSTSAQLPLKCPKCGERAGYRAAECTKCSLVYSYHEKECPYCKTKLRRMLSTLKEVEEARKKHEQYLKRQKEMEEDGNDN
jgi:RNA polymerase subunit RPABC4/transcription elongation factor Spt4